MKKNLKSKIYNTITIIGFCLCIFTPFALSVIQKDQKITVKEKRQLAQLPKRPKTISDLQKFPKLFDNYYSDQLGLRAWLLQKYNSLKYKLGDSPKNDSIIVGKDGWFFLGSIEYNKKKKFNDPIGDYRNVNQFTLPQLVQFAEYLTELKVWLNNQGIEYYFVIAPNKHTIYSDKLPDYITKINKHSATDQLVGYIRKNTNVEIIDLRAALIKEKNNNILYYNAGTHWNFMGGNIAQFEIMKVIHKMFPDKISPQLYDNSTFQYSLATDRFFERNIESYTGEKKSQAPYPIFKNNLIAETDYATGENGEDLGRLTHTNVNTNEKLNAIIFRDSFFRVLEPYFTRKFKKATYIWKTSNLASLKKHIPLVKPDLVIEEWVERRLPFTPKNGKVFKKINVKNKTDI